MFYQLTLQNSIHAHGVGVHSGRRVHIALHPAAPNTGVVFRRTDQDPVVEIPAKVEFLSSTNYATCLHRDGHSVSTIEHLMSALCGLGIDNVIVDIDADELPIMDGSAMPFVFLLQSAGIEQQPAQKQFVKIQKPVEVRHQDSWVRLTPHNGFKVSFGIDYDHPVINRSMSQLSVDFSSTSYERSVARARTFGFLSQYEALKAQGLAGGASLHNTVVLDDSAVVNGDGLRDQDEFIKHKILDAVGDMFLLGHQILGAFEGYKSGHTLNAALLKKLVAEPDAWYLVASDQLSAAV